jgi:hypothetical protein
MCASDSTWDKLSGKMGILLDPGGFFVEKIAPSELDPYTGLHGTAVANKPPDPPKPWDPNLWSSNPYQPARADTKAATAKSDSLGDIFAGGYNQADALSGWANSTKVIR